MSLKQLQKNSSLSPRGEWLVSQVEGEAILDIGFAADLDFIPDIFQAITEKNPTSQVIGLDLNAKKVGNLGLPHTLVGDMFNLPFKTASFDFIVAGEIFEHLTSLSQAISDMHRVLKTHGKVAITTPSPYGLFRFLKAWLFQPEPGSKQHITAYLENYDHKVFWEPLSLCNLFILQGFKVKDLTTTNLSLPYLPNKFRNPKLNFWPFTRLGTYTCIVFEKTS